ncbi:MAG: hypothetical protein H8E35_07965 [Ardenticatenia bacterium]|nr:hypothetical protein [Ardenticatenia bacterium]
MPAVIRQLMGDGGASALDVPHEQFKEPGTLWYDLALTGAEQELLPVRVLDVQGHTVT